MIATLRFTGSKTANSEQATTISRMTTTMRPAIPERKSASELMRSVAVLAASPGVTRTSTTPKLARPARTANRKSAIPPMRLALRWDQAGWFSGAGFASPRWTGAVLGAGPLGSLLVANCGSANLGVDTILLGVLGD